MSDATDHIRTIGVRFRVDEFGADGTTRSRVHHPMITSEVLDMTAAVPTGGRSTYLRP
ncbi:hypothetical protein ACTWPT_11610 [Nonomuraea sp. 3N208]|uniref:hypothetical protein n=1 Tax=Nonomuraea sp. 3N208 TaxID=3457421 RepID=UPI003FCCC63B